MIVLIKDKQSNSWIPSLYIIKRILNDIDIELKDGEYKVIEDILIEYKNKDDNGWDFRIPIKVSAVKNDKEEPLDITIIKNNDKELKDVSSMIILRCVFIDKSIKNFTYTCR